MKKIFWIVGILLVAVGCTFTLGAVIVTFLLPPTYASSVRIVFVSQAPTLSEVENIKSQAVLERVAANLNLTREWSVKYKHELSLEDTCRLLRKCVVLEWVPNNYSVSVRVFSDNPAEAATIADGVASAFLVLREPDSRPPRIVEKAKPNLKPARPNKSFNIILSGLIGAFFGMPGMMLMIMARKGTPGRTVIS